MITLADLKGLTEEQVISHLVKNYWQKTGLLE